MILARSLPQKAQFAVTVFTVLATSPAFGQSMDLNSASVSEILAAQASGRLTCTAIANHVQARIAAVDLRLKAFITVNPKLVEQAKELEAKRQQGALGPLHCIPVAVKDNFNTKDLPTTGGSVLLSTVIPSEDSAAVAKLRAAGALIVGKTNLDELAVAGSTISSLGGQTLNPYDQSRFAAGSSGGSAVAVSTGMATLAIGTETVNSLRNAANSAGVVAIRLTHGLVSRAGVIPLSTTMDVVGGFGRSVAEASTLLSILVGRDPADPATSAVEGLSRPIVADPEKESLAGKRIGVLRNLMGRGAEHLAVNSVFDAAIAKAKAAGVEIVEIEDQDFDSEASFAKLNINNYEFKPLFERYLASLPSPPVTTVQDYVAAGKYPATMKSYLANAVQWKAPLESDEYFEVMSNILAFRRKTQALMRRERLDTLAYPIQKRPSLKLTETPRPERNGIFASALGFPAVDLPAGFTPSEPTAPKGVPVGIDLMGLPFQDASLISLAASLEEVLKARQAPEL
jgi:amidase